MTRKNDKTDDEVESVPHPRETAGLLGQRDAEDIFRRAIQAQRMPHAWLVTGPRGIGKATLAYRVVRHIFANDLGGVPETAGLFGEELPTVPLEDAASLEISPEHRVFQQVASGSFPDLRVLERKADKEGRLKREIPVEDVRQLTSFLHMTASNGSWRAGIIDPVDELTQQAANALLKILEEPPEKTLLVLVSHNPGRLLPTVRSRCRHLALPPLNTEIVEQLLEAHLPELDQDNRAALARLSEGSIGRALDLYEAGGLDLYRQLVGMMSQLPQVDTETLHQIGDILARDSQGSLFRTMSDLILWWLGRLIRMRAVNGAPEEILAGENEIMRRLAPRRELADWMRLWENLTQLFQQTERASLDRKQAFITAFGRLQGMSG
ncbi:DNA polymerase III subunit delta' [Fodinicurvata halophila]|uniref:DNA polymerase III subunit delta n=1 Tax=Fodinicurvata halophila TaxID=1419723 RepID=A0ABV8UKK8_9PROT